MTFRKYLVLFAVAIFAACGDVSLARGMKDFGPVTSTNWHALFAAVLDPWVLTGICFLLLFFCTYLIALSWADLTYVVPATAISYVLMAFLGKFFLHETVTGWRWLGVALITAGVGVVAGGPSLTPATDSHFQVKNSAIGRADEEPVEAPRASRSDF